MPRPGRFTPRKDPVPIVQEARRALGPVRKDVVPIVQEARRALGPVRKDAVPSVQEARRALGPVRKTSRLSGFIPRTVQPVASLYTDRAIPAHYNTKSIRDEEESVTELITAS